MPRAATKSDLLEAANEQFSKLWTLMDSLSEEQQHKDFQFDEDFLQKQKETHWVRDKNLRDILIHLYEWHILLLNWIQANQFEPETPFLPPPYNWKTYSQMNISFMEKHQTTSLEDAKDFIRTSHRKVISAAEDFSNDALFSKKYFSWVGASTLGSYFVSVTASHYDWAMKKINQHKKSLL